MCIAALFESAGEVSASMLLAGGYKMLGITSQHRPNPLLIDLLSSSYGRPPTSVATPHHKPAMGGAALSKTAGNMKIGGGCGGWIFEW
jgi:hypothetical protein